jgi:hypothetical protein
MAYSSTRICGSLCGAGGSHGLVVAIFTWFPGSIVVQLANLLTQVDNWAQVESVGKAR